MVTVGDIVLYLKTPRSIISAVSESIEGANSFIFKNTANKRLSSQNRTPVVGDKVLIFKTKNNSHLTYIAGTCADAFKKYVLDITPTNPTPYTTNNTIAVYDNTAHIVGLYDGKIGFSKFNGDGFDNVISPYALTYATIDITSDGTIWIAGVSGSTLYAIYYDGSWHQEAVYSGGEYGMYPNLKLDNNDIPYILFTNPIAYSAALRLANRLGGAWSTETLDTYTNSWGNPPTALNFDADNYPYYINRAEYTGTTCYEFGYKDADGWHYENCTGMEDFCIDADNYPHGSYGNGAENKIYHYYKDISGWHTEEVGSDDPGLTRINMYNGKIHIFQANGDLVVWYHQNDSGAWERCVIDSRHATGWQAFSNFEISTDSNIHVSYYLADVGYIYALR